MSLIDEPLAIAAAYDGVVPYEVADWVDNGAHPDPDGYPEETESPARTAGLWRITTIGAATWAMRKVRSAKRALDVIDDHYAEELRRLNEYREREQRRHKAVVEFFEDRLGQWALTLREADPKTATFGTPAGKVVTSKPSKPWKVALLAKEAVREWALANGRDMTRPELRPITDIRRLVQVVEREDGTAVVVDPETGEVVPGLTAEPTHTTYRVEVEG